MTSTASSSLSSSSPPTSPGCRTRCPWRSFFVLTGWPMMMEAARATIFTRSRFRLSLRSVYGVSPSLATASASASMAFSMVEVSVSADRGGDAKVPVRMTPQGTRGTPQGTRGTPRGTTQFDNCVVAAPTAPLLVAAPGAYCCCFCCCSLVIPLASMGGVYALLLLILLLLLKARIQWGASILVSLLS